MHISKGNITDFSDEFYIAEMEYLSPAKRSRILRFTIENDKKLGILGDHLAREAVSALSGVDISKIMIGALEDGQPVIESPEGLDINISISHSGSVAVAAASDMPVGIDVEAVEEDGKIDEIMKILFAPSEISYVNSDEGQKTARFYEVWTKKEAFLKLKGTGFTGGNNPKQIDVMSLPSMYDARVIEEENGYMISIVTVLKSSNNI